MRIKKVISLSFLLLANVIMLAHPVVFHHHHDQMPVTECAANQEHHCDKNTEQHCHHENKSTHKCCIIENCHLDTTPFTKANSPKQIKPTFNNFVFIANTFPIYQIIQAADLEGLSFREKPYLPLFCSEFISQSMGLRAPPGY